MGWGGTGARGHGAHRLETENHQASGLTGSSADGANWRNHPKEKGRSGGLCEDRLTAAQRTPVAGANLIRWADKISSPALPLIGLRAPSSPPLAG